jgi:hypothetical protein
MYLHEFFLGQHHGSGHSFGHLSRKVLGVVRHDGLDTTLVVHVQYELVACIESHFGSPILISRVASEEILHRDMICQIIII